jgi:plastocyanin
MRARLHDMTRSAGVLIGACAIAGAGLTASCFSERSTAAAPVTCDGASGPCVVDMRNFAFQPAELHIPVGATVTWVNGETQVGLAHTSTSDGAGWDSGFLAPGASFSHTFTAAGQFPYHCVPHPTMLATIVVQ